MSASPRARFAILSAALAFAVVGLWGVHYAVQRQRIQVQLRQKKGDGLEAQLAEQLRARDATARELALAERQLNELLNPAGLGSGEAERARQAEIAAWLARVKQLKALFERRPDQRIPELRLLTDDDWLRVGKRFELDTEEKTRKALAAVRTAAKNRFAASLRHALPNFAKMSKGEAPKTPLELGPYLTDPTEVEFLPDLEIYRSKTVARPELPAWGVREKAAIDVDYDSRYAVSANGGSSSTGAPLAWIPDFQERSAQASHDFSAANKGAGPSGIKQLIPYFNPPLDEATVAKLKATRREDGW